MSHPSLISLLTILYVKSATLSLNATNSESGNLIYRQHFTALFKNTRTLRFKSRRFSLPSIIITFTSKEP